MKVNIHRVDSLDIPRFICSLEIELFDRIYTLKYKVYELTNIIPQRQRLIIYQDNHVQHDLTEGETCSDYPIVDNTDIMLIVLDHESKSTGHFEETKQHGIGQIPSIWLNPIIKVIITQHVKSGNLEELRKLLNEFESSRECKDSDHDASDLINRSEEGGWMCIHFASYYGHFDALNELLCRGANPNKETSDGWTALQIAAYQGKPDCKF